jgi:hypothetical protein
LDNCLEHCGLNKSQLIVQLCDEYDEYNETHLDRTEEYKLSFSICQIQLHAALDDWQLVLYEALCLLDNLSYRVGTRKWLLRQSHVTRHFGLHADKHLGLWNKVL